MGAPGAPANTLQQRATAAPQPEYFMYVGTYTSTGSKGIQGWRFNPAAGSLTALGLMAHAPNPSFLAVSPDNRFLFAVNWKGSETVPGDTVSAYRRDAHTGALAFLNKTASRGEMPTHLAVDRTGRLLMSVNFGTGSVTGYRIQAHGRLSPATAFDQHSGSSLVKERQDGPHAHAVVYSPDTRFALVADLGLDKIFSTADPAKGQFTNNSPPYVSVAAGTGPRHLAFHPNGRFLFANGEINSSVTVFAYDSRAGTIRQLQSLSTLPSGFKGNNRQPIQVHPNGRFLYVSNRGHGQHRGIRGRPKKKKER